MTFRQNESNREVVYRMRIKEGKSLQAIREELGNSICEVTLKNYMRSAILKARELGDEIPLVKHEPGRRKGGFTAIKDEKPLSPVHQRIGVRLNQYRELTLDQRPQQFVDEHEGFPSAIMLRRWEAGAIDFKLTDLMHIAQAMKTTIPELMEPQPVKSNKG